MNATLGQGQKFVCCRSSFSFCIFPDGHVSETLEYWTTKWKTPESLKDLLACQALGIWVCLVQQGAFLVSHSTTLHEWDAFLEERLVCKWQTKRTALELYVFWNVWWQYQFLPWPEKTKTAEPSRKGVCGGQIHKGCSHYGFWEPPHPQPALSGSGTLVPAPHVPSER